MKLSFVIPVHNEAGNVGPLHDEIVDIAPSLSDDYEIIFVDDGSTDTTPDELNMLSPVTVITLRKNFGQTAALDAGIKHATGDILVTLDGDMQNNPGDVPSMLEHMKQHDLDVVCGWRKKRRDPLSKRFISSGARWLRNKLIHDGVHDAGCTLRVYDRSCFQDIHLRGEMHRFIPAILKWRGYRVGEVVVNHRPRNRGESKYTFRRAIKGFLDILSIWFFQKFSSRPLHMLGTVGLGLFVVGFAIGAYSFIARLLLGVGLSDKIWPLAAVFLMLFGMQMFVSGLIMDLVISSSSNTKHYVIKDIKVS